VIPRPPLHALVLAGAWLLLPAAPLLQAQAGDGLPAPRASPHAVSSGMVGLTEVTVDYSRPGVRGRPIWGALVPYGEMWRAGANMNTTVSFATDVAVEGQPLAAGTYSFFLIPFRERSWTAVFNSATNLAGTFGYEKANDVLRVEVTPVPAPFEEWLRYDVTPVDDHNAELNMYWEELRVPLRLQVDLDVSRAAAVQQLLAGPQKDNPQLLLAAARWALARGTDLEQALGWATHAVELDKTFTTLGVQAQALEALGRDAEAAPLKKEAWLVATEDDLSTFGGRLMSNRQYEEAVPVFELAVRKFPKSWKAHDQLGEAYRKSGKPAEALAAYESALGLTTDEEARARLTATIAELRG